LQEAPDLREDLRYLWLTYVELKNANQGPISFSELTAYMHVKGWLANFEIDAIMAMDALHSREALNNG
jgi:hypothetical protein